MSADVVAGVAAGGASSAAAVSAAEGAVPEWMADWSLALAHRAEPHGGLPVGAVLVQPHSAERLRKLLLSACGARLPLETHRLGPSPHRRLDSGLMVHCPPPIATLFEAAIAGEAPLCTSLAEFVSRAPVVYLSGVRRHERVLGRAPPAARGLPAAPPPPFTFAEVFAGIGGFRLGLEPLGGVCSLACEVDPMACATYRLNFARDGALLEADLTGLPADELPAFDLLAAGFPCQTFSVRGEQRGVESTPTDWRGQPARPRSVHTRPAHTSLPLPEASSSSGPSRLARRRLLDPSAPFKRMPPRPLSRRRPLPRARPAARRLPPEGFSLRERARPGHARGRRPLCGRERQADHLPRRLRPARHGCRLRGVRLRRELAGAQLAPLAAAAALGRRPPPPPVPPAGPSLRLPQYRERLFLAGVRCDCEARPMDWSGLCYEGGQPRGTCLGRVSDASPAHASDVSS